MPMNMERSPRDIAGGYLLLMLAQGESKAETSSKCNATSSSNPISSISSSIYDHSSASIKSPLSHWNHCDSAMIHKHPQLGLYVAKAALPDSILSLSSRYHPKHSYYWGGRPLELEKGRCTPPSVLYHSPYTVAQDRALFESSKEAVRHPNISLPLSYHLYAPSTSKKTLEEMELQRSSGVDVKKHGRNPLVAPPSPSQDSSSSSSHSSESSLPTPPPTSDKIPLPQWFTNSTTTVVIGKGHLPRKTPGNYLLRQLVREHLQAYQESNRRGRATIVSSIYQTIRSMNPEGKHFGNFTVDGEWQEAKEHAARDKIAATFRDCLSDFYKSSTKSKVAKRRTRKAAESHSSTAAAVAAQYLRS